MWCNQPIWRSEYLCQLGIGQRVKERNSNILASWLADSCVCVCVLCACACACFPSIGTAAHHIAVEFQFSACLFFLLLFLCALLLLLVSICNNSSNSTWLLCFRFILHIYIYIHRETIILLSLLCMNYHNAAFVIQPLRTRSRCYLLLSHRYHCMRVCAVAVCMERCTLV